MSKRPQAGENDEDIIKLQEEFYSHKAAGTISGSTKFLAEKPNVHKPEAMVEENDGPEEISNTFEQIPLNPTIGRIIERKETESSLIEENVFHKTGFPAAKRRDLSLKSSGGSIFSQQMKKLKADTSIESNFDKINMKIPERSYILTGEDKNVIHMENATLLSRLSEQEILEERERLLATTDPAIVSFLKSKRRAATKTEAMEKMGVVEEQRKASENLNASNIEAVSDVLTRPKAEKWIHFDKMETEKLAWMKSVDMGAEKSQAGYEARFDFNGWLLPFKGEEINEKNRVLYHHGAEPNRPGYTLQELFQLCRSNIMQQKVTALNTIANLLSLETSGVYDDIIDIPIEQVFFVLRFCLDDNATFVLNAAVKPLRNLVYYPIDEASLDTLLGFGIGDFEPSLCSEERDDEDDTTVNDQQLVESNLVKCLVRTGILTRLRYIINTVRPSLETISYVLDILVRLSRDSIRTAMSIFQDEDLLISIFQHFIPKTFKENLSNLNYGVPMKQAIKLCRLLACRSRNIAENFVTKFKVIDSLLTYVSNQYFSSNANGIQLQTECLHFWSILIAYGLTFEQFRLVEPVLIQMLRHHYNNTNLSTSSYSMQAHFAAIMNLLRKVAERQVGLIASYVDVVCLCLEKYSTQFNTLNDFLCGKLLIISSLIKFLSSVIHCKHLIDSKRVCDLLKVMLSSQGFMHVTTKIRSGSNILTHHISHKPSKNLISAEAAVWNAMEHIVPVLQTNSCIPFLNAISKFVKECDDDLLKLQFLNHPNINGYLLLIRNHKRFNLTSNWFTKVESELIMNVLQISYDVHKITDTSLYYSIAVRCLCVFNSLQKRDIEFLFKNVIFNKNYYPGEVLLNNLNIAEEQLLVNDCLQHLDTILDTYIEVLGLKCQEEIERCFSIDIKIGNVIPLDWIYSPIIVLYANSQKNETPLPEQKLVFIILNCLRWVYIYETYFSDLSLMINPTDKFCRLACVFLASDDVFFVPEVHILLEKNLERFIEANLENLDFKKSVHGLSSFQDLYKQLLEQYQGVSYGDPLFSNFILMPLMQKADVQYRKILWSEYSGITQILRINSEQLMCPKQIFMEPPEEDISLLKCYRKYVLGSSVPEDKVLKIIAKHHLDCFVVKKRQEKMEQ